jgi:small subunit ribosomal protein S1
VEILPGVEGLVHISELAQHHVENPREVVSQGDLVNVKIIEVDAERRRLSLSLKRIEDDGQPQPLREDGEPLRPQIDLSEEVFADAAAAEPVAEAAEQEAEAAEPVAEAAEQEAEAAEPETQEAEPEARAEGSAEPVDAPQPTTDSATTDETAPAQADQPS